MTRILLIRHGETDWNKEGRMQGQKDVALNANGLDQARRIASGLVGMGICAIYTSDLRRAYQTAETIGQILGIPLCADSRLREVHLGEWEGRLARELNASESGQTVRRFIYPSVAAPPGGETAQQVQARLIDAVNDIITRHAGETVAVVTHGFAVAVLLSVFRNIPLEEVWELIPSNGEIYTVDKEMPWNSPN